MKLGDTHILMRLMHTGAYHVSVTYSVLNGAELDTQTWEHTYIFSKHQKDVLSELASLLANVSHDIPQ